jgi:hypothetical protein
MSKKKQSSGGKSNGAPAKGAAKQFSKSAPVSRRPPRHQGR